MPPRSELEEVYGGPRNGAMGWNGRKRCRKARGSQRLRDITASRHGRTASVGARGAIQYARRVRRSGARRVIRLAAAEARVQDVAEAVTEQVEAEDGEADSDPGEERGGDVDGE